MDKALASRQSSAMLPEEDRTPEGVKRFFRQTFQTRIVIPLAAVTVTVLLVTLAMGLGGWAAGGWALLAYSVTAVVLALLRGWERRD